MIHWNTFCLQNQFYRHLRTYHYRSLQPQECQTELENLPWPSQAASIGERSFDLVKTKSAELLLFVIVGIDDFLLLFLLGLNDFASPITNAPRAAKWRSWKELKTLYNRVPLFSLQSHAIFASVDDRAILALEC